MSETNTINRQEEVSRRSEDEKIHKRNEESSVASMTRQVGHIGRKGGEVKKPSEGLCVNSTGDSKEPEERGGIECGGPREQEHRKGKDEAGVSRGGVCLKTSGKKVEERGRAKTRNTQITEYISNARSVSSKRKIPDTARSEEGPAAKGQIGQTM